MPSYQYPSELGYLWVCGRVEAGMDCFWATVHPKRTTSGEVKRGRIPPPSSVADKQCDDDHDGAVEAVMHRVSHGRGDAEAWRGERVPSSEPQYQRFLGLSDIIAG
jgi:hypothetical protein